MVRTARAAPTLSLYSATTAATGGRSVTTVSMGASLGRCRELPYLNTDDGFPDHPKVDTLSDGGAR